MDNSSYIIKDTTIYIQKDSIVHWWHYATGDTIYDTVRSAIIDSFRVKQGRLSIEIDRYREGLNISAGCDPDTIRIPQYIEVVKFKSLEESKTGFFGRISRYFTTGFLISIAAVALVGVVKYIFSKLF